MHRLWTTLALAAALLAGLAFPLAASAEAPMVRTQAPGYYRHLLGDFEVTVLLDGTIKLPVLKLLTGAPPQQLAAALKRGYLNEMVETSVNAYLINTGSKLVLVDAGTGGLFGPAPALLDNLRAAGHRPEQVDEIYITHLHGDHVGGVAANGQRAFPNAVLRVNRRDADFWLSEENMNKAPPDMRDFFKGAMASVKPYADAGKFQTFEGPAGLVPGVRAEPAYGHTPGHTIYHVESKGEHLVLWGDLMHVGAVQFDRPQITIRFDVDSRRARAERLRAFAEAARKGWLVGVSHVSFPGLGHLRADGKGYDWVPVNYSTLK